MGEQLARDDEQALRRGRGHYMPLAWAKKPDTPRATGWGLIQTRQPTRHEEIKLSLVSKKRTVQTRSPAEETLPVAGFSS